MGGFGGYRQQNDFTKQIIRELDKLIEEINNIQENIYGEKLFLESATTNKQKLKDFIDQKLESNLTLLIELSGINENVSNEDEFYKTNHELFVFGKKIKDLLIKSKDLTDLYKWLELSNYKDELDAQKEKLNTKVEELNTLLDNEKRELSNKKLLRSETMSFENSEIKSNINAVKWLIASIILSLVLIFVVCFRSTNVSGLIGIRKDLCCLAIQDKTMLYIAYGKYISSYVLIYSILIYALKVSIKNYNANRHNEIVNRNKKLTLFVALDLSHEGSNPELLDIAAKELFSQHSTGYNNTTEEKSTSNFVNNIVESVSKNVK
jgi:hypothetical protein